MTKMKVIIRGEKRAVIISFRTNSEKFDSPSERNKFFRGLYGWKQVVTKQQGSKRYTYIREGVLDEVPHIKVDDSVFIVAMRNMKKIMEYFDQWEDKVKWDMKRIMLEDEEI